MGGCWSCVACRSHPEAEPKDEDEEGALTGHPRNPTHVVPFSGGLPNVLGDTLGKELTEEPSVPEPLTAPGITNDILEEELTKEPSVPEPLPAPGITNDILEEELTKEPSVPEPLPAPGITNDILEEELTKEPSVPEVRLQRWEREDVPADPAALLQPSGSESPLSSASLEVASIPPSTSTSSLLLHPSPPPPPSPPPLEPDLSNVEETLQSLVEIQVVCQRDLRSCQECVQSFKALRGQLRRLRSRLARVEATMGIVVPPRELYVAEEGGEGKFKETTVLLFT
ncbi:uncharacterized protein LOC128323274 [Hemicordylus capensis]|uniref:uncharacterized protein LOC128323274 n=1 Tax=Hemicordylus capensis TaxID=884348 RepID=UPI0023026ABA|nr:uncharacterized protein LOC128323274 [Hemicordylus capensis]